MPKASPFQADIDTILSKRHDNGADYWATREGGLGKGSPYSAVECALMLCEIGLKKTDAVVKGTAEAFFSALREDGRCRLMPKITIYPCHTATAARVLCWLGYGRDKRLRQTFEHLFEIQHTDGGWRCNTCKLGRSPVTDASNPGPTLEALDAFRFTRFLNSDKRLDRAVQFLLGHWATRKPLGPCEFGIGSRFMQLEYPFLRYNLFYYVYVLSFYRKAHRDRRFKEALSALKEKIVDGKIVVENLKRGLGDLEFCRKGQPSAAATRRYRQILKNLQSR